MTALQYSEYYLVTTIFRSPTRITETQAVRFHLTAFSFIPTRPCIAFTPPFKSSKLSFFVKIAIIIAKICTHKGL